MKQTSLSLLAALVIVGSLSIEQLTATRQPAAQSQSASQAGPVRISREPWSFPQAL